MARFNWDKKSGSGSSMHYGNINSYTNSDGKYTGKYTGGLSSNYKRKSKYDSLFYENVKPENKTGNTKTKQTVSNKKRKPSPKKTTKMDIKPQYDNADLFESMFYMCFETDEIQFKRISETAYLSGTVKKLEDGQTEPDNDEPQWESLEEFESLDEASDSEFFRYYMEADRLTDNKVKEILETQNDTANYGSRCNIRIDGTGMTRYAEQYDSADPAKRQYFQVEETKDGVVYSATHESIFMWMELGNIYSAFFPEREEPKYFIHIENEDELNTLPLREKFILQSLRAEMHKRLKETIGDYAGIDDNDLIDEELTTIAQHGTWSFLNGQYEESLNYNLHLLEKAKQYEKESGNNMIAVTLTTLNKIKSCYSMLGNNTEVQKYSDRIIASKKELYAALEAGKSDLFGAIDSYTTELVYRSQDAQNDGDMEAVADYCKEIISLLERDENCFGCPETLFIAYTKYAYILDEENRSDEAIELYENFLRISRNRVRSTLLCSAPLLSM